MPNFATPGQILTYSPELRAFSRSLCTNRADAEDLFQQTILRAIENIHRYKPGTYMRAWLLTIMRNAFLNNIRKRNLETAGQEYSVSSEPRVEAPQEWKLRQNELAVVLDRMPAHYRDAVVLIGVLGESYGAAAEILHCDIGTIKSRVNRARGLLRASLP